MLFAAAFAASAAGVSTSDGDAWHTITVSRPELGANGASAEHLQMHCGMVAAYMPKILKDYRLVRVGEEFLDVQGQMLVFRSGEEAVAAHHWVDRTKMLSTLNDHYYEISRDLPVESGEVVLHPEVCDEFADTQKVTDRRACEFVFLARGCGLLGELDALNAQIQDGISRAPAASHF